MKYFIEENNIYQVHQEIGELMKRSMEYEDAPNEPYIRLEERCKKYVETFRCYSDGELTYEEQRLIRVKEKYSQFKEVFNLSNNNDFDITLKMVNNLCKQYLSDEESSLIQQTICNYYELSFEFRQALSIDNYIDRISKIIFDAGGRISRYTSTAKNLEKMKFIMSVDVAVMLVAIEDFYVSVFRSNIRRHCNYIIEVWIRKWTENYRLTDEGKKRTKAVIDMLLPEELQPEEFKEFIRSKGFN